MSGIESSTGIPTGGSVAIGVYVLLWRTSFGFQIRSVGLSRSASAYAGMPVKRTITLAMALSGAMCGLAGAILVFGSISHRMVTDGSLTGFTGSAGFNGIVVALFGGLNPLWTIVSAYLFGGLIVGGSALQVATGVPSDLVTALSGTIVVLVVSLEYLRRRSPAVGHCARAAVRLMPGGRRGPSTGHGPGGAGTRARRPGPRSCR